MWTIPSLEQKPPLLVLSSTVCTTLREEPHHPLGRRAIVTVLRTWLLVGSYRRLVREGVEGQRLLLPVDQVDGVLQLLHCDDGQDGAKDLLLHQRVVLAHVHHHRGR